MSLRDDQLATLKAAGKDFDYYNIANLDGIDHLPYSLKVLVENLVRNIDGANITDEHVKTLLDWDPNAEPSHEIQFTPSRVIMQDFTGVPCIVDLATMRDAVKDLGGDPEVINPQVQSDMVIDHSVQYELGKTRIPVDSLIKLAQFYDVDMNYITGISKTAHKFPKDK